MPRCRTSSIDSPVRLPPETDAGLLPIGPCPALVVDNDGVKAINSLQEVEQFFSGAKEQYNALGITDTRADIQGLEWATDKIAIVDVRWPYLNERGEEKGEEASTYILRRDDAGNLKLHVALMRGASTPD